MFFSSVNLINLIGLILLWGSCMNPYGMEFGLKPAQTTFIIQDSNFSDGKRVKSSTCDGLICLSTRVGKVPILVFFLDLLLFFFFPFSVWTDCQ